MEMKQSTLKMIYILEKNYNFALKTKKANL